MITSSTPSHKRDQDPTQVPIERAFLKVFQTVRRKLKFVSVPVEELKDHMLEVLIQAATSKCIDFNIAANRKITHGEMSFFLMSSQISSNAGSCAGRNLQSRSESAADSLMPALELLQHSRPCSCSAPKPSRRGGVPACGNVWAGGAGGCGLCAKYTGWWM